MSDPTSMQTSPAQASAHKKNAASVFFAGLLPVIAFTYIEDNYGTWWGLIAGMVFGVGEIIFELYRYRKVNKITWIGNGLLLFMGAISLFTNEGIWFKLQPAIIEGLFTLMLWGGLILKKNLVVYLAEQQGQSFPDILKNRMNGMAFRIGLFFAIHAALATWAALYWTSAQWALLKGVGLTVSFLVYMIAEAFWLRLTMKK